MSEVIWRPSPERIASSPLRAYLDWLEEREGRRFPHHDALWRWSVEDLERFWTSIVEYYDVAFTSPPERVLSGEPMPRARWFPGARLNWAEYMLRRGADEDVALVCAREGGHPLREITFGRLREDVAALAGWLRRAGVEPGDRVAAYLPNTEHAVIGVLAAAAVGATWACCSPDFGPAGTVDRLAQLEPTVLIAVDGYHWNGRDHDRADVVAELRAALGTVRHAIHVSYLADTPTPDGMTDWSEAVGTASPLEFEQVEFSHPLWVLFTSGTTGLPKGLVHGHGGITLQGLEWSGLYAGLRRGERLFSVTSTGWALWNIELGALAQGAGIVLYEGSPLHPADSIWDVAARSRAEVMLLGAAVVTASSSSDSPPAHTPRDHHDLTHLRRLMVSGSSLPSSDYHWVLERVGEQVCVDSTSGGTDISGSFVGGNEYAPVRPGRIGGPAAGVDCAAWVDGRPVVGEMGDLVVTQPMPSMPVALWNDPDFERYTDAYFDTWPGVWRHGDWVTFHDDLDDDLDDDNDDPARAGDRGGLTIHGRSDSTLNRHGVRLGTGDYYDALDGMPEIAETLVVGVDLPGDDYWLGLFVVPGPGIEVDDELTGRITDTLRSRLSPRHVPDEIVAAPAVPHTINGKRLEVPVKKLLMGLPLERAASVSSVDSPDVLDWYARFARERFGSGGG